MVVLVNKFSRQLKQLNKFRSNQYNSKIMLKKKNGRFNGLTEEEVKKKDSLPDYLEPDLDIVFLGINPSLMAAFKGRYYAGPGNHFYKLLHASGLVPQFVSFEKDCELLKHKIGLTNIVDRATRSSADLTTAEIKKGCDRVVEKLKLYKPKIAVFNGKCIYQVYAQQIGKTKFDFGLQQEKIGETVLWVVPSSSARCSNFPRMTDKLHFYEAIKKHLEFLKGIDKSVNITKFYSMSDGIKKQISQKKSELNKNAKKSSNIEQYPQYTITEILDGSQKPKIEENEEKRDSEEDFEENSDEVQTLLLTSDDDNDDDDDKSSLDSKDQVKSNACIANDFGSDEEEKDRTNLKRSWKDTATISSSRTATAPDKSNEVNCMALIKQRLLEKKDNSENVETSQKVKKLNFSNLQKTKGQFLFSEK